MPCGGQIARPMRTDRDAGAAHCKTVKKLPCLRKRYETGVKEGGILMGVKPRRQARLFFIAPEMKTAATSAAVGKENRLEPTSPNESGGRGEERRSWMLEPGKRVEGLRKASRQRHTLATP